MTPPQLTPLKDIADALRAAQRIAIAAHVRPDGDAVGSVMGLALSLRAMGKTVYALLEDGVPANLAFLPEAITILTPPYADFDLDVAVALDTASHERLGVNTVAVFARAPLLIDVDHHPTNPSYRQLNHIDGTQPAVGQIVYELLCAGDFQITEAVMQHLFTAISTDTGSFQYSSTTARTHEIAAEMMRAGLDTSRLAQLLYQTYPTRRLILMRAMLNEMSYRADGKIVSWNLTQALMSEAHTEPGHPALHRARVRRRQRAVRGGARGARGGGPGHGRRDRRAAGHDALGLYGLQRGRVFQHDHPAAPRGARRVRGGPRPVHRGHVHYAGRFPRVRGAPRPARPV